MDCNIEKCPLTARIIDLEKTKDDHEIRLRNAEGNDVSISLLSKDIEYIKNDVAETKMDIKKILEEPAERWDAVKLIVIAAIVTSVINIVFSLLA